MRERKKILAIASGGGHWVQLQRLRPVFSAHEMVYATVDESYQAEVPGQTFRIVPNANLTTKFALLKSAWCSFLLLLRERPDVVVTTGAAVGFFAVRLASLFGMKTVWIDSIANAEELSLSGKKAGQFVDLWLTQWEHLATENGPTYLGNVL